jgi:hypothetical protein
MSKIDDVFDELKQDVRDELKGVADRLRDKYGPKVAEIIMRELMGLF